MPTDTPSITVTDRVDNLIKDAANRAQADLKEPLSTQDWREEQVRKLYVSLARTEDYEQEKEGGNPSRDAIDSEVTR